MLFKNKYPYTDFHELNLDWIIKEIQRLKNYVYNSHTEFNGSTDAIDSIRYGRPIEPPQRDFVDLESLTAAQFFEMWDAIVNDYPEYFEKVTWTDTETENVNYYYIWRSREHRYIGNNTLGQSLLDNYYNSHENKVGATIIGAIHGDEKSSIYSFYELFKSWLQPENNIGSWILDNYSFIIVPVINIFGWDHNIRYNEAGVNINRNFSYGWADYEGGLPGTDRCKGSAPYSEWETRFGKYVIDLYDNTMRYTWPIFDLHAHHYTIHDDKRVTWYVSNDTDFKEATVFINSWLYDKITEIKPSLIPDYDNGEIFTRWVSSISTPSFDNEARVNGIKDMALETPQRLEDGFEYDIDSQYICDLIIWNVIINCLEYCRTYVSNPQEKMYYNINRIGLNDNDGYTLSDICYRLPRGARLLLGVNTDSYLNTTNQIPEVAGEKIAGFLEVVNDGATAASPASSLKFICLNLNYPYIFEAKCSSSGVVTPWQQTNGQMTLENITSYYNFVKDSTSDIETIDSITLNEVCQSIPLCCTAYFAISEYIAQQIYEDVNLGAGMIKIYRGYTRGSDSQTTRRVEIEFIKQSNGSVWTATYEPVNGISGFKKVGGVYGPSDFGVVNIFTTHFPNMENGEKFVGYLSATEAASRGITVPNGVSYATYELTKYENPLHTSSYGVIICQTVGATLNRYVCRVQSDGTQGNWSTIVLS